MGLPKKKIIHITHIRA